MPNRPDLTTAITAVRAASLVCREIQNSNLVSVITKEDGSPVTTADYASQAIISRSLSDMFPNDEIVAEESADVLRAANDGRIADQIASAVDRYIPQTKPCDVMDWIGRCRPSNSSAERFWLVDPIDGTKGFVGKRHFAVCLALVDNGKVKLGVVGCPRYAPKGNRQEGAIFYATAGGGAYGQLLDDSTEFPIHVNTHGDIKQARFCHSVESSHTDAEAIARTLEALGNHLPPTGMDGQVKYATVADGTVDAYLRIPRSRHVECAWDHAAGSLLVTEAGGRVSDLDGKELDFSSSQLRRNRGIIASNGAVHDDIVGVVSNLQL